MQRKFICEARLAVAAAHRRQFSSPRKAFKLVDLVMILALMPLGVVVGLSCSIRQHEPSWRVKCASNLRQIGQAILLYANENKGAYPRTRYVAGPVVTPTWGTGAPTTNPFAEDGPAPNDVTGALFLLIRTQDIGSDVFVCPQSNAEKWDFGGGTNSAANWSNWQGSDGIKKHLSYSYANPYLDEYATSTRSKVANMTFPDFAIASDINPGTSAGGNVNILTVTTSSSASEMKPANSRNHDGDGQNVLYWDGDVEFVQNPFVGIQRDNIFARRAGSSGLASAPPPLARSPYDVYDTVLLPPED